MSNPTEPVVVTIEVMGETIVVDCDIPDPDAAVSAASDYAVAKAKAIIRERFERDLEARLRYAQP